MPSLRVDYGLYDLVSESSVLVTGSSLPANKKVGCQIRIVLLRFYHGKNLKFTPLVGKLVNDKIFLQFSAINISKFCLSSEQVFVKIS
jgi:hypothetical protein